MHPENVLYYRNRRDEGRENRKGQVDTGRGEERRETEKGKRGWGTEATKNKKVETVAFLDLNRFHPMELRLWLSTRLSGRDELSPVRLDRGVGREPGWRLWPKGSSSPLPVVWEHSLSLVRKACLKLNYIRMRGNLRYGARLPDIAPRGDHPLSFGNVNLPPITRGRLPKRSSILVPNYFLERAPRNSGPPLSRTLPQGRRGVLGGVSFFHSQSTI